MKILHVLSYSIPNLSGYTIRGKYLVESEKKAGLTPMVITSPKYAHEDPFCLQIVLSDIEYYRTSEKKSPLNIPFLNELVYMKNFKKDIRDLVQSEGIDIIHAHSPSLNGLSALGIQHLGRKVPLVYQVRALWEDAGVESGKMKVNSPKYLASYYMENLLLKKANHIVVICEGLKKELVSRGYAEEKISIVKNGVDTDVFAAREKNNDLIEKYDLDGKCVVGFIGSFFKFEGVSDLVKAFKQVISKRPNLKLMLIGRGEEFEDIENMVKNDGLQDHIIVTGSIPHKEIMEYYSVLDILVYPRKSTRLTELVTPLKPLEAMSMGKAVVGSNIGGLRSLIQDGKTGLLYQADSICALSDTIDRLVSSRQLRDSLGSAAMQETRSNCSWLAVSSGMPEIYNSVLEKASKY